MKALLQTLVLIACLVLLPVVLLISVLGQRELGDREQDLDAWEDR